MPYKPTVTETPFEFVTSVRAGRTNNNRTGADTILITPLIEPGLLELYCKKVTEHYEANDTTSQFCCYELRWKPTTENSTVAPITYPITHEYEFIRYSEVKTAVVFLLRKKEAWLDSFPYFFWCQESDPTTYNRFFSSMELCLSTLTKEKSERDEIQDSLPLDLNDFMKEHNVASVLNDEEICKRLYPHVPERFRSQEGLKKIYNSDAFKKNLNIFQSSLGMYVNDVLNAYGVDTSDMADETVDHIMDQGTKTYIKRIEEWAKKELDDEKNKQKEQ